MLPKKDNALSLILRDASTKAFELIRWMKASLAIEKTEYRPMVIARLLMIEILFQQRILLELRQRLLD